MFFSSLAKPNKHQLSRFIGDNANEGPKAALYHIWYIGIEPAEQGESIGTTLLQELVHRARDLNRLPVLETCTLQNLPWYRQQGFDVYREMELGYSLYCLKAARREKV